MVIREDAIFNSLSRPNHTSFYVRPEKLSISHGASDQETKPAEPRSNVWSKVVTDGATGGVADAEAVAEGVGDSDGVGGFLELLHASSATAAGMTTPARRSERRVNHTGVIMP